MALFTASSLIAPHSISASTPKMLTKKILSLQAKSGYELKFINFYYDTDKKEHVGWYYMIVDENSLLQGVANAKVTE